MLFRGIGVILSLIAGRTAGQCHAEGDKEYCLKGYTTTSAPDCHTYGHEVLCFGTAGPTATLSTITSALPVITNTREVTKTVEVNNLHPESTSKSHANGERKEKDSRPEPAKKEHGHGSKAEAGMV